MGSAKLVLFPNGITITFDKNAQVNDQIALSAQDVGSLVRQRRQTNKLTQRELSELAGVGLRFVSELERGKSTLRMDAVNRVLAVFGLMLGAIQSPRAMGDAI